MSSTCINACERRLVFLFVCIFFQNIFSFGFLCNLENRIYFYLFFVSDWRAWYATFDTYWLRYNWPDFYEQEKKQLLEHIGADNNQINNKKKNDKKNVPKKSSTNINKSEKRGVTVQERKRSNSSGRRQKKGSIDSNDSSDPKKYRRRQKTKYEQADDQSLNLSMASEQIANEYFLKNRIAVTETGILWVNIMEAVNVPDCDTFSDPDCYCKYYVTSNDPCFNRLEYYTKTEDNTVLFCFFCIQQKIYIFHYLFVFFLFSFTRSGTTTLRL